MLTDSGRLRNIGALVSSSGISIWGFAGVGLGEGVGVSVGSGVTWGSVSVISEDSSMLASVLSPAPGILHPVRDASDIDAATAVAAAFINNLCSLKRMFLHSSGTGPVLSCIPIQIDYNKQITNSSAVYRTIYGKGIYKLQFNIPVPPPLQDRS